MLSENSLNISGFTYVNDWLSFNKSKTSPIQKSPKKKIIVFSVVAFVVLILGITVFQLMGSKPPPPPKKPTPTPTPAFMNSKILPVDTNVNSQILVPYVPHFLDLRMSDLPNALDIKNIFNYKKNLILVASTGITEFDPKTNDYVRQNDPRVFNCINSAALIGNLLYVGCNGSSNEAGIYVINLENGKLEKLFRQGSAILSHINIANTQSTLWVGSANEIVKINTKTGNMEAFSPEKIRIPGCKDFTVFAYNNHVWTTCSLGTISLYNEGDNTWQPYTPPTIGDNTLFTLGYTTNTLYFLSSATPPLLYTYHTDTKTWDESPAGTIRIPSSKPIAQEIRATLQEGIIFPSVNQLGVSYLSYFDTSEKTVKDFELFLSNYLNFSDIIAEKRYLFTKNAIDILKNGGFPSYYKSITTPIASAMKMYVDPSENYAVFIGPIVGEANPVPHFTAQLVNIRNGEVLDLLKDNQSLTYVKPEIFKEFSDSIQNHTMIGVENGVELQNNKTGKAIIKVDFPKKSLTFSQY